MKDKSHQNRAIVIGGSMSGLLAARVLSDFFKEVIVIERDKLPVGAQQRRGVPQGYHAHALLAGGQRVLEQLFPGILDEMVGNGALPADPLKDGTWFFEGAALYQTSSGLTGILASRPFLESQVRRRVRDLLGVKVLGNRTVRELASSQDRDRVNGVILDGEIIHADLVVDSTGRGSRAGDWLKAFGYDRPDEESVEVDLVYTTRIFRAQAGRLGTNKFVVVAPTPEGKRGGVIGIQENDEWIVTLFGHFGNMAPKDLDGFVEYSKSLPSRQIYDAINDAEPIGDACTYRFSASRRRRYERLRRLPEGFLVFGDAICSFNPIYGQGMSVAALQADSLRRVLDTGTGELARRFFKEAAKVINNPWDIAVGADLRMPETVGPRSKTIAAINWYIAQVHMQAHADPAVSLAFNRVSQLLDSPPSLMRPGIAARVLLGSVRRKLGLGRRVNEPFLKNVEAARSLANDGF